MFTVSCTQAEVCTCVTSTVMHSCIHSHCQKGTIHILLMTSCNTSYILCHIHVVLCRYRREKKLRTKDLETIHGCLFMSRDIECSLYFGTMTSIHGFLELQSQQATRKDSLVHHKTVHCSLRQRHVVAHKGLTTQSKCITT